MGEKFDEFSKHVAQKHSRRGALKLFGASIFGAAMAAGASRTATATPSWNGTMPAWNSMPKWNGNNKQDIFNWIKQLLQSLKGHN